MRPRSKKTILLLSDGRSNTGSDPITVARKLYNDYDDLAIVALGIGDINKDELQNITNHYNPLNPLVVLFKTYNSFHKIVNEITEMLMQDQDTCSAGADVLTKKRK